MHLISGIAFPLESLNEVAILSDMITVGNDYLEPSVRLDCEHIISYVTMIHPAEAADAYLFLKAHSNLNFFDENC